MAVRLVLHSTKRALALVAQWREQRFPKPRVAGSIPAGGTPLPFGHADDCKIVHADPDVQIPWSEIRRGVWEVRCVGGVQYHHDPITDDRVRNDLLKIGHRGAPQCELHGETDPAVLWFALKAVEKDRYWWVQCSACDTGWQVPHYAESVG
jgi:hypothetical protein